MPSARCHDLILLARVCRMSKFSWVTEATMQCSLVRVDAAAAPMHRPHGHGLQKPAQPKHAAYTLSALVSAELQGLQGKAARR